MLSIQAFPVRVLSYIPIGIQPVIENTLMNPLPSPRPIATDGTIT